jgi:hypothetical protein
MKDINDMHGRSGDGLAGSDGSVATASDLRISLPRRDEAALRAVRATALSALRAEPAAAVSWKRQAATMTVLGLTVTALAALMTARLGGTAAGLLGARLPAVALLLVAQGFALWSAIAPGRWWGRKVAWGTAAIGAALLLYGRASAGAATPTSEATGWICSTSHLGVALFPAVMMLGLLRGISWSVPRALTAGLAIGISGLIWGEIACERSLGHVLLHHVGAMALIAIACAAVAKRLARGAHVP